MKNEHTGINTTPLITEAMLLAYVDGSLAEPQRLAVEARLERDPEMAAKAAAYRAQNEALHALFDRHLAEPLDPVVAGLEAELRKADSRKAEWRKAGAPHRPSRKAWGAAALAASVALVAFAGGFALAEYRSRAPVGPVTAFMQQFPAPAEKVAGIMPAGGALRVSPAGFRPPDLSALGLRLTGERQLGSAAAAVTHHLSYERADGRWVSLYVGTEAAGDTPLRAIYPDGRSVLAWRKDGLSYSLVGTVGRDAMMAIAGTLDGAAGAAKRPTVMPKTLPDPAGGLRPAQPVETIQPPAIPAAPTAPSIAPNPANRPDGAAPRARDEGAA
ncbi:anti-sigma factor family protein [Oceanibaculum nanhaiense]|jgi:anti-sigma factor RsiW|uniref:anti-sigma factor family protein n=1 Tax=Oceanibaculum nanhaiense TaxID=1909734 RepID=UPI003D2706E8